MKRSEVSTLRKFSYLTLAINEVRNSPEKMKWKTDLIGLACQYSHKPKLKREDFDSLINLSIKNIIEMVIEGKNIQKTDFNDDYELTEGEFFELLETLNTWGNALLKRSF